MTHPFFLLHSAHFTCPTWPLPAAGFLPWAETSRLHLLSWRVQGWAAASQRCFIILGVGGEALHGPGPGMSLIYELINRSSVWVSKTAEVCELFHVTVSSCWLSPLGKHRELSFAMLLSSLTCFQKQLGRKRGRAFIHLMVEWVVWLSMFVCVSHKSITCPWKVVTWRKRF